MSELKLNLEVMYYVFGPDLESGCYITKQDGKYKLLSCHPDYGQYLLLANNQDNVAMVGIAHNKVLLENRIDVGTAHFSLNLDEFKIARFVGSVSAYKDLEVKQRNLELERRAELFCDIAASNLGMELLKTDEGYFMEQRDQRCVQYFDSAVDVLRAQTEYILADEMRYKTRSDKYKEILSFVFRNGICTLPENIRYDAGECVWKVDSLLPLNDSLGQYSSIVEALVVHEKFQQELLKSGLSLQRPDDFAAIESIVERIRAAAITPEQKFQKRLTVRKSNSHVGICADIVPNSCIKKDFCSKSGCQHARDDKRTCPFLLVTDKLAWLEDAIERGDLVFKAKTE